MEGGELVEAFPLNLVVEAGLVGEVVGRGRRAGVSGEHPLLGVGLDDENGVGWE